MANVNAIQGIRPPAGIEPGVKGRVDLRTPSGEFGNLFEEAISKVEQHRNAAEEIAGNFMRGETEEVHQVVLASQRAELAFEAFLQVRNKVVQAYQEVMRMQM